MFVVGCHRSGTSMLAGALQEWLLNDADPRRQGLLPPSADNPEGFYESQLLVDTSEALLALVNAAWDRPFLASPAWSNPELLEHLIQLRPTFAHRARNPWIDKDPRVSLLLPAYRHILLRETPWIAVVRNPDEVARSLELRNGFDPEKSALIWWLYHHHLLRSGTGHQGLLVSDAALLVADSATCQRLSRHVQEHWAGPCDGDALMAILGRRSKPQLRRASGGWAEPGPLLRAAHGLWQRWSSSDQAGEVLALGLEQLPALVLDRYETLLGQRQLNAPPCSEAFAQRTAPFQALALQLQTSQEERHQLALQLHQSQLDTHTAKSELHQSELQNHQLQQELHQRQLALHQGSERIQCLEQELGRIQALSQGLTDQIQQLLHSTSWRLTRPLRLLGDLRHGLWRARPTQAPQAMAPHSRGWAWVSGEPATPGHHYRVEMPLAAARQLGIPVRWCSLEQGLGPDRAWLEGLELLILWRTPWSAALGELITQAHQQGTTVVFDLDDAMVDPTLARIRLIDGIRSMGLQEAEIADLYGRIRQCLVQCRQGLASTAVLAKALQGAGTPSLVLTNGFDEQRLQRSQRAQRQRRLAPDDGLLRLGYASGSRTHQRDFGQIAPAVAAVLRAKPNARLVLFREAHRGGLATLDLEEFPELTGLEHQIEWRPLVPVHELASELARFDINLAPLDTASPFCQAKSELKFFEAALVRVCTIASPTAPFAAAIRHGHTGWLAESPEEWQAGLLQLLEHPDLRQRLAQQAHLAVLWPYGPEARRQRLLELRQLWCGGGPERSAGFLHWQRQRNPDTDLPELSACTVVQEFCQGEPAAVAVVIPVFNYGHYLAEALNSVAAQNHGSLELIVVNDGSTDGSQQVAEAWLAQHRHRFRRCLLLANAANSGLALSRNNGFNAAEAPLVLPLDADNTLHPGCLAALERALGSSQANAAHPTLVNFGEAGSELLDADHVRTAQPWNPTRFQTGNYIDAMALIRRSAWAHVGGYTRMPETGWEDYQFWCKFVEAGLWSEAVPASQAGYRVHGQSMLHTITMRGDRPRRLAQWMQQQHPWIDLSHLDPPGDAAAPARKAAAEPWGSRTATPS